MKKKVIITILLSLAILFSSSSETTVRSNAKVYSEGEEIAEEIITDKETETDTAKVYLEENNEVQTEQPKVNEETDKTTNEEKSETKSEIIYEHDNSKTENNIDEQTDTQVTEDDNNSLGKSKDTQDDMTDTVENNSIFKSNLKAANSLAKTPETTPSIEYQTHIECIGWQESKNDGDISGTTGQSKRIEAIKMNIDNSTYSGGIEYQTYVQDSGWQDTKKDGQLAGTTGESKRIEILKANLTGDIAKYYDVYYRVHAESLGWLGWAKNGEYAGTNGYSYRLEALQMKLVKKGTNFNVEGPAYYHKDIEYQTHIECIGWQEKKYDGETTGTTGQSKRIEAIIISLTDQEYFGNIEYKTYVEGYGWEKEWKKNGEKSGTTGQSKRIEAIQINLTGDISNYYDVFYRVHAESLGWLGWAKNGEYAGTNGYSYRLEAAEIKLIKKSDSFETKGDAYNSKLLKYQTHIESIGWQDNKYDGEMTGTTGQSKRIEAIKISLNEQKYSGNIEYKTYVEGYGWEKEWKKNGEESGTTGQGKRIEAIQINLTGDISNYYDVFYRVHAERIGWLGWAKNGEYAGTYGYSYKLEAAEILLLNKGQIINDNFEPYIENVGGYFVIASALDENKVIEAYCELAYEGSNISLHDRNNGLAQIWKIEKTKNGTYRISSSFNPDNYITADNSNVALYSNKNNDYQAWQILDYGNGYVSLISKATGLYMDVLGANTANETNIQVTGGNGTNAQKFKLISYNNTLIYKGVDVSSHQNVDWNAAQYNINFAILRIGYGSDYIDQDDTQFLNNVRGCEAYNIPYGVYIYSYALNTADAVSEANHVLRLLENVGRNFKLGVWFDMEDADGYKARHGFFDGNQSAKEVDICDTFLSIIESHGYEAGIYASLSWLNGDLNNPRLDRYGKWVAHWNGPVTYESAKQSSTSYPKPYKYWQFCSDGHIYGITGGEWNNVDLNLGYNIFS